MHAAQQYQTDSVSTQQRGKLIAMLYEGAVRYLNIAKDKLADGDYALKGVYIGKAQDIVVELNNCLDMEVAPELAGDLRALYNFLCRHLNHANVERSAEKVDDCIRILAELGSAWEEVATSAEVAAMCNPEDQATATATGTDFEV